MGICFVEARFSRTRAPRAFFRTFGVEGLLTSGMVHSFCALEASFMAGVSYDFALGQGNVSFGLDEMV